MSTYDFSSPYLNVAIVDPDGNVIPLWTNAGEILPALAEAGLSSLSYVTEVSVDTCLNNLPVISVTLSMPYREAIKFLNSELIEWGVSRIQVEFGYSGGTQDGTTSSNIVAGVMMQPSVSIGPDGTNIRLVGNSGPLLAVGHRNYVLKDTTRREVMKMAAVGSDPAHPRDVKIDFTEADQDGTTKTLLDTQIGQFSPSMRTDWDVLTMLCKEALCWPLVSYDPESGVDVVKLIPRTKRLAEDPTKIFSLMEIPKGILGPEVSTFPILAMHTPTTAIYLPGAIRFMFNQGIKSADRSHVTNFYDDTVLQTPRVGPTGAAAELTGKNLAGGIKEAQGGQAPGDGAIHAYADPNIRTLQDRIKGEFVKSQGWGINLHIDTLGIPDLLPGNVVSIRGLGKRLDGNYGIFRVVHLLGSGGFSTKFEAWSNTKKMAEAYKISPKGPVNEKEAKADTPVDGKLVVAKEET
jgi:hypothetical protein